MNARRPLPAMRAAAVAWLREREVEINREVIHRALSAVPPTGEEDSVYLEDLRRAIEGTVDHALQLLELGEARLGSVPEAVPLQARNAAKNRVGLETVVRRYASGFSTFTDFLHQAVEATAGAHHYPTLHRELTALFDKMVTEASDAYRRAEFEVTPPSNRARQLQLVRRLLVGDLLDARGLDYEMPTWHEALVARHLDDGATLERLARALDRRLLLVEVDETTCWAWLGGRRPFGREELVDIANHDWPERSTVGCGTPARGATGWRLTHQQASKALGIALRRPRRFTAYSEIALTAAILGDEDLRSYLEQYFLAPLSEAGERGDVLRNTLRAYFEHGGNVSSTASALRVSRQTVASRIRTVETKLDRSIGSCRAQIEAALSINDFHRDGEPRIGG